MRRRDQRESSGSARRPRIPFVVNQVACPDGQFLTVAITHTARTTQQPLLRIGSRGNTVRPTETVGEFNRFTLDVSEYSGSDQPSAHALFVVLGPHSYRIPRPTVKEHLPVDDGPVARRHSWLKVTSSDRGYAQLSRVASGTGAVTRAVYSIPEGARVTVEVPVSREQLLIARSRRNGREAKFLPSKGGWDLDLTALPDSTDSEPEFWDVMLEMRGEDVPLIANTGDIGHYGRAVNIPIFRFRRADCPALLYAKLYFAGSGHLVVRTGIMDEDEAKK
jgi:hypothetical protein